MQTEEKITMVVEEIDKQREAVLFMAQASEFVGEATVLKNIANRLEDLAIFVRDELVKKEKEKRQ